MDRFEGTPYRQLALIGAGGSARVYEVEHVSTKRRWVAKVLHESLVDDPKARERLLTEGRALAPFEHQNLVQVSDIDFLDDGTPFVVMERLEGGTLRVELKRRGALLPVEALRVAWGIASALDATHRQGIVHRDVKPENIHLQECQDGTRRVKLIDWGLAKFLDIGVERKFEMPKIRTRENVAVGTPHYMAPEQARGEEVDGRADIYALGVVLYEMLTGVGPVGNAQRSPPSTHSDGGLPRFLDQLVMKAMAEHPEARFQSPGELIQALVLCIRNLVEKRRIDYRIVALSAVATTTITFAALSLVFRP